MIARALTWLSEAGVSRLAGDIATGLSVLSFLLLPVAAVVYFGVL